MIKHQVVITCEHAGNEVPVSYSHLFVGAKEDLNSHKGWDPGAWEIALYLSAVLQLPVYGVHTTRLLIEPNRSLFHDQLFSQYTKSLGESEKSNLINEIYLPHRNTIEGIISEAVGTVVHLSIHTFTPLWQGQTRDVEIGLLFDPDRKNESAFCDAWKNEITKRDTSIQCKFNEPYKGIDDGFTTYLRTRFPDPRYLGIEIEVNQKFTHDLLPVKKLLLDSLNALLQS